MPNNYDPNDTRWLAERTAAQQRERERAVKATSAMLSFAALRPGRRANVRKTAIFERNGLMVGLVELSNVWPVGLVTKAKAGATPLRVAYDSTGKVIGTVDPANLEQLAAGEKFVYTEDGTPCGILGTDNVVRPVQRRDSGAVDAAQADRDAAAQVAATAPGNPGGTVRRRSGRRRHGRKPPRHCASFGLTLARERVAKAQAMDTRNLGPRDRVIELLDQLEPVLKRAAPPQPDAERYLRELARPPTPCWCARAAAMPARPTRWWPLRSYTRACRPHRRPRCARRWRARTRVLRARARSVPSGLRRNV